MLGHLDERKRGLDSLGFVVVFFEIFSFSHKKTDFLDKTGHGNEKNLILGVFKLW